MTDTPQVPENGVTGNPDADSSTSNSASNSADSDVLYDPTQDPASAQDVHRPDDVLPAPGNNEVGTVVPEGPEGTEPVANPDHVSDTGDVNADSVLPEDASQQARDAAGESAPAEQSTEQTTEQQQENSQ